MIRVPGAALLSRSRTRQIAFSITDQGLSAGGMLLANIALARTQTKTEYGIFALSYSAFTFLAGLHNAAILEAYTVYGSGRYHESFSEYASLLWRCNLLLSFGLTAALTLLWGAFHWIAPAHASRTFLGMALASGVLLTASFVRRTFYMRRRPDFAARFSCVFFLCCVAALWLSARWELLDGFWVFVVISLAWCAAGATVARELPGRATGRGFLHEQPGYWSEHWKYSKWVFVTALVFQLTTQGYYWLSAVFLSVKDVADLRAMYNLVTPVDQVFVAMAMLVLPVMAHRYAQQGMARLVPLWRAYCTGVLVLTGGFAASAMIWGKAAMHVVYAGRFDDIARLICILALLPVVMGIGNSMNLALKAIEKPGVVFWAYLASGAATFLLGIPLLMHFGLRGAVYGMLASGCVYATALAIPFWWFARARGEAVRLPVTAKEDSLA